MPSYQSNSPRSPMKSLTAVENIPVLSSSPPKKSKQLGIEMFTKKRSLDIEEIPNPKKKPKVTENDSIVNKEVKAKCHQCHQYVHLIRAFRCTELKRTKGRYDFYCCGAVYCMRCIDNRYDISKYLAYKDLARVQLPPGIALPPGAEYPWTCPACAKECDCSSCRKKEGLEPLGPIKRNGGQQNKQKASKKEKEQGPKGSGIEAFFKQAERNENNAAINEENERVNLSKEPIKHKPSAAPKPRRPALKVVEPPPFHPVRATVDQANFELRLKIREFVLQFEKIFTRKLHVPTKHIVTLADPCDTPSSVTMKHLFLALMKIIQCDVTKEQTPIIKEIIRKMEKSPAGDEMIPFAAKEWLSHIDSRSTDDATDLMIASRLIDHAIMTATCREEMDSNLEKLKPVKTEYTATVKSLRQSYEGKKSELGKERMRLVNSEEVEQWKKTTAEIESQHKDEMRELLSEFWSESRRLSPRTGMLGVDVLGNRYWVFGSRKTKERNFGGWVVIQTPEGKGLPGESKKIDTAASDENEGKTDADDGYQNMKSWYYVNKIEDVKQLISWTTYLAAKAAMEHERKTRRASNPKGSPNKRGQSFAVEIPVKGPLKKAKKMTEFLGATETKALCEELHHAAEWILDKFGPDETETEEVVEDKEQVVIDGEIVVLDP